MRRINVTKTFLPPLEEYETYLQSIWKKDWLTNQGPLLLELQEKLEHFLGVDNLHLVGNGTLALQVAMKALEIDDGEVITTPFTYVATTSAILWQGCTPVYVDIDPETLCIDPTKIEDAITEHTKAIMPVHVFGNACDVDVIAKIAKKHHLKVIYDAAHAFGAQYKGRSLLGYGDISTGSFHATKLFHTIEGGCIVAQDKAISEKVELIKRFGHNGDEHLMLGINAKATEFQAAMGLCNLKHINDIIADRKKVSELYDSVLPTNLRAQKLDKDMIYNYAYYPVLLASEEEVHDRLSELADLGIYPRRYFFPSINTLPYLTTRYDCPVSEDISRRILCLPLYGDLEPEVVRKVGEVLSR